MVTNDGRNNIISLGVIAGFSILIVAFIFTFVGNMEQATTVVTLQVTTAVERITNLTSQISKDIRTLGTSINTLVFQQEQDAKHSKESIALFLEIQNNNTALMVDTINQMSRDNNVTRENQTNFFVEAIQKQLNATATSQNLTKERIAIETETNDKLENLTQFFANVTLGTDITQYPPSSNTTR